jgi:hypothetical protein
MTLEWADHELVAIVEIEADPVQLGQRVENQRRKIGGVGDPVALATQQAASLLGKLGVLLGLRTLKGA